MAMRNQQVLRSLLPIFEQHLGDLGAESAEEIPGYVLTALECVGFLVLNVEVKKFLVKKDQTYKCTPMELICP